VCLRGGTSPRFARLARCQDMLSSSLKASCKDSFKASFSLKPYEGSFGGLELGFIVLATEIVKQRLKAFITVHRSFESPSSRHFMLEHEVLDLWPAAQKGSNLF